MGLPLVVFGMLFLIGMGHALISKQHAVVGGQFAAHYQRVREAAPDAAAIGRAVSGGGETIKLSGGGDDTLSFTVSAAPGRGLIAHTYSLKAAASQYQTPNVTNACLPRCKFPLGCLPRCKPPFEAFSKILNRQLVTNIISNGLRTALSPENIISVLTGIGKKRRPQQNPPGGVAVVPSRRGNGEPDDGKHRPDRTGGVPKRPADQVDEWAKSGKIRGNQEDIDRLKKDLNSPNEATRKGAEAEVRQLEAEIAAGRTPEVRGAQAGPDQADYEVKARTEPFTNRNNAQNFFNDRIKKANDQFKGQNGSGRVIIDLGDQTNIQGAPITREVARDLVKEALSKGGRGTNITKVVVKDGNGNIIYEGLGE